MMTFILSVKFSVVAAAILNSWFKKSYFGCRNAKNVSRRFR